MSIRFILGRAGTGKTHHCLDAVRARLREDPLWGHRVVLLVPEQASLQMERALIADPAVAAYSRAEVLSFRRLARRVLSETGGLGDRVLTPLGRVMVLRHLMERHRDRLRAYAGVLGKSGFVAEVSAAVVELMHEQVTPEMLEQALVGMPAHSATARKVHDLACIYAAYRDYLRDGPADPERFLELAAERLGSCAWLGGCEVWVDGFAGFTRQETSLLVAVAELVSRMEVALLLDPADSPEPMADDPATGFGLFAATQRTLAELRQRFAAAGLTVKPPLVLPSESPPRFRSPGLEQLERSAFRAGPLAIAESVGDHGEIEILAFPNRRLEVEAALCRVQDLVRRKKDRLRCREIALITRDISLYHDLISAACAERNIPVFIDRRQPVAHHPLVELLRSLCLVGRQDFSREAVSLLIKTGLLPIREERLEALENFVIAYGIAGAELWTQREWGYWKKPEREDAEERLSPREKRRIRDINETRRVFLRSLGPWVELCGRPVRQGGKAWVAALQDVLASLNVEQRMEAWSVEAEEDGRPGEAEEHHQVWGQVREVLAELSQGLGDAELDVVHFAAVLEAGLAELTLGLTPPTLDQLLVGTIERSRHPDLRAVLLLGFNEGVFPRALSEPQILNDEDRDALAGTGSRGGGRAAWRLGSTKRQRIGEERYLAYVALTRASEYLWVSSAEADEQGKELFGSPFVRDLQNALGGAEVRRVADPEQTRSPEMIGSAAALAGGLAGEFGSRSPLRGDKAGTHERRLWNRLYVACWEDESLATAVRGAMAALKYSNEASLDGDAIQRLYGQPFRSSVTRLECFASCPFRHFAQYGLRLEEREEHRLAALELGTVSHKIMEDFVREMMAEAESLHELEDDVIERRLQTKAVSAARELHDELLLGDARSRYLIERCSLDLGKFVRGLRSWSRRARFRPRAAELAFGLDEQGALPALELTTPKGRRLNLWGRIDRVDVAELRDTWLAAVVDYKRQRDRRLSLCEVYHGLALQLVTYLLALQEHGRSWLGRPVEPAGALYLPLLYKNELVAHPGDASMAGEEAQERAVKGRGLLNGKHFEAFDTKTSSGSSPIVSAYIRRDGAFGRLDTTDVAQGEQFRAVLGHVKSRILELGDRMFDGDIRVAPARLGRWMPCSYCLYRSVCRFDVQTNEPRTLREMKRTQALDRMTGGRA